MRGALRTTTLATAAVAAAVALYVGLTLPRASVTLAGALPETHVPGAYHIHSTTSDGSGTIDQIAAAATRAGLRFIILTDHGDGTRAPQAAAYRHGVLVIDGVELNTSEGHLVALGLRDAAPYRLAGRSRDVLEDVHRMGGVAVIAHPDSPNDQLRWRGPAAQTDGVEWLNADSEWRDKPASTLFSTGVRALLRGPESIVTLFGRPGRSLQRIDAGARSRPFFTLAAADAHARIGWREHEEPRQSAALEWPTYETLFRTLAQVAIVEPPLSGDAGADARRVLTAITTGRSYSVVRGLAWPAALTFTAESRDKRTRMGERLSAEEEPVTFRADIPQAPGVRVVLLHDGRQVAAGQGGVVHTSAAPGVYRVEAAFPDARVPWIVSNPIVVESGRTAPSAPVDPVDVDAIDTHRLDAAAPIWRVEQDPRSRAAHQSVDGQIRFDFELAPGASSAQYTALVAAVDDALGIDRVQFVGRASRPMRLSIQVRLRDTTGGQRWRRSVFLDETPRDITIRLQEFEPVGAPTSSRPIVVPIQSLLFVVDTVNMSPGSQGTVWLSNVSLGVPPPGR